MSTIFPYRTHSVDHVLCVQTKSGCDNSITKINASNFLPCHKQFVSGFFMYSTVNTRTNDRIRICSIYHCIYLHIYNIISYYFKWHIDTLSFPFHIFQFHVVFQAFKSLQTVPVYSFSLSTTQTLRPFLQ